MVGTVHFQELSVYIIYKLIVIVPFQLNKENEDAKKDGEKKANGVTIDALPTIIIEVPGEEKPSSRRGSLRFRGN